MSLSPETSQSQKRRILVVDDEPTLRLAFSYSLKDELTDVESVGDGRSALQRLSDARFDLVILDLRMPHFDGEAVLSELRSSGNPVPVILCTAMLNPGIVTRVGRLGVVDFLLKPVMPDPLRQAVKFVLHPEGSPGGDAWQAARAGNFMDAARRLRKMTTLSLRDLAWLKIWESTSTPSGVVPPAADGLGRLALNGQASH